MQDNKSSIFHRFTSTCISFCLRSEQQTCDHQCSVTATLAGHTFKKTFNRDTVVCRFIEVKEVYSIAHIPLKTAFVLGRVRVPNSRKNIKMYMANASPNERGPNATYIPPARVGNALGPQGLVLGRRASRWVHRGSCWVFGHQHVGIGIAKVSRWGYCPMQTPNARDFALLQWNMGLWS